MSQQFHESYVRHQSAKGSSDRSFGFVFAAFFLLIGAVLPLLRRHPVRIWALVLSAAFAVLACFQPSLLRPLNRAWFRLALALSKITNPIVMAVLFFVVLTPIAFFLRMIGRDPLRVRRPTDKRTLWIQRSDGRLAPETMERQF